MRAVAWLVVLGVAGSASAQGLPTEPVTLGGGRFVLGAEVTATAAPQDPGFFNYTGYEYNALRNFRVSVSTQLRASDRLQVLAEIRMDRGNLLEPHALYARIRPWPTRRFDIQIGRVPPTFGAFGRGAYGTSNLLIGYPLAYQYLTSLKADALPANAEELLRMRGRGWRSNFTLGDTYAGPGLPLINAFKWDTGVQVHGVNGIVEWTGALTTGSLSNPRVDDDNDGRQLATRVVVRPHPSISLGFSGARGAFLSHDVAAALPSNRTPEDGVQAALAFDAEYSIGRFLTRGEVVRSRWTLPLATITGSYDRPLSATSWLGEARYRVLPGVHLAARVERLDFSRIISEGSSTPWEAPIQRYEVGAGWSIIRNVILKVSWQKNIREAGRVRDDAFAAAQITYWF